MGNNDRLKVMTNAFSVTAVKNSPTAGREQPMTAALLNTKFGQDLSVPQNKTPFYWNKQNNNTKEIKKCL